MNSKFFTNRDNNSLENRIKDILEKHNIKFLEFLIGYFRISGFKKIATFLEDIEKIRILVGIDIDKLTYEAHSKGRGVNLFDNEKVSIKFIENQILILNKIKEYELSIDESVELLAKYIQNGKLEIRISKSKNIHSKIYIFREEPQNRRIGGVEEIGSVITGSSNLTSNGLSKNYEFNVELRDSDDILFSLNEFEYLWSGAVEISFEDISKIKNNSYLKEVTPFEIYIKFLIEYFEERVDIDFSLKKLLPEKYMKLTYQFDAVTEGINKIKKHNGFFLADVVGLGKTVTATLIVKKLILDNVKGEILVVAPPSIQKEWKETFKTFLIGQVRGYEIVSIGKLNEIEPSNYEIVIIDESHKFKNFTTTRYKDLERICKERTKFRKKIMLISATPINNKPQDIANQLYLFQDKRNSTIPSFPNLELFFSEIDKTYQEIISNKTVFDNEQKIKLEDLSQKIRDNILREVMVRRTRTDILNSKIYKEDLEKQGVKIPKIEPIKQLTYEMDDKTTEIFDKSVDILINKLQYERYKILFYLKKESRKKYGNVSDNIFETGSIQLAHLMKLLFIKRFESSFYAFQQTLSNQITQLKNLIKMFSNGKIYIGIKTNFSDIFEDDDFDEKIEVLLKNNRVKEFEKSDFEDDYLEKLQQDLTYLEELEDIWKDVIEDPKLETLKNELKNKKNKKIVIFTESKQTALYLDEKLKNNFKVLTIHGDNRDKLKDEIRKNFDANYDIKETKYNILISTDTLSEGVNMHRSNIIYNYDIPWNSTRLMQRIGRINRIGTTHDTIFIYNFIPSAKSDELIDLSKKAFVKLQAFHTTLGEDNPIYSLDEKVSTAELFNQDLKDETDEELEYLEELRDFKKNNLKKFKEIKKLSNKIRVQRKKGQEKSFVFIKTELSKAFLMVKDKKVENLNFIEFVKNLKANSNEKGITPLKEKHFEDVKIAQSQYYEELKQNIAKKESIRVYNKIDKKVLQLLKAFFNKGFIKKEENELLTKLIKEGRYQNLSKEIEKLRSSTAEEITQNIKNILVKFSIELENEDIESSIEIDVILSESFIKE